MKKTTKSHILAYLQGKDWVSSTELDRAVASIAKAKEATVSRQARELAEEGKIDKDNCKVVWYRLNELSRKRKQIVTYLPNGSVQLTYA